MGLGESYRQALALARQELGRASGEELGRRVAAAGAELLPPGSPGAGPAGAIRVSFLGRPLLVSLPDAVLVSAGGAPLAQEEPAGAGGPAPGQQDRAAGGEAAEVPQWLAILTLHYLNGAGGEPLTGELIPFRDLPGGRVYDSNFEKRVRARLVRAFSHQPALLLEVAARLGGEAVDMGDAGVRLVTFPRVPLWLVLWAADEEFPPGANVLFDSSVRSYLCTEDAVVLCEQVTSELIKMVREGEVRRQGA
ncbi:MAG: DUF3786 domain-containing protein [Bacillota bacterium]|nr:DUF3786 domain-containing protein [Bacillota bacterium]MDI7249962.1 DUF3786 domain-containing protein [Bacillota bacterium]